MKGNEQIINKLNDLLAEELTASNQYMVHAEMCENWQYGRLYSKVRERAIQEMKHAESLIERILFLEGRPIVSKLSEIRIGDNVQSQLNNDLQAEMHGWNLYNEGIKLAMEAMDNGTKDLLESILETEEKHIDWLEAQLEQIQQIGIENYLAQQVS
ncbi:bacterioferritin [Desulfomonile tiedjei]|uniref:Bacterioferritin n=1 Tax=Desulfomonile tiedjei (strain ATCC 49306 / DSM 6799 / DCB-1) TaxID=706587 RepID=I4C042_DESTA|nr:bacterioferritin [Desulfomonile tiedjei]AFM22933.1 bacterioferritin [Desulfomonile tiedjei DSM 6799]